MAVKDYDDFNLVIEQRSGLLCTALVRSEAGEASQDFDLPFSRVLLENFVLKVGLTRRSTRSNLNSEARQQAKLFGESLFEAVFQGDVRDMFAASIAAASNDQRGLRIRLTLRGKELGQDSDAPEITDIPWEYLYASIPGTRRFLVLSTDTLLVRDIETGQPKDPWHVDGPLRILVMISNPTNMSELGLQPLAVEKEWERLQQALSDVEDRVTVRMIENATFAELRECFRTEDYHILHFIGHGNFDQAHRGTLLLEDERGMGKWVTSDQLAENLHDQDSLRLVVLNSCLGARSSATDPFAGMAQSLIGQGIPGVIAMQFEITDAAAVAFAAEFYGALADGVPVDACVGDARRAISDNNDIEWGTPVLYMRSPDGKLFSIDGSEQQEDTKTEGNGDGGRATEETETAGEQEDAAAAGDSEWALQYREAVDSSTSASVDIVIGAAKTFGRLAKDAQAEDPQVATASGARLYELTQHPKHAVQKVAKKRLVELVSQSEPEEHPVPDVAEPEPPPGADEQDGDIPEFIDLASPPPTEPVAPAAASRAVPMEPPLGLEALDTVDTVRSVRPVKSPWFWLAIFVVPIGTIFTSVVVGVVLSSGELASEPLVAQVLFTYLSGLVWGVAYVYGGADDYIYSVDHRPSSFFKGPILPYWEGAGWTKLSALPLTFFLTYGVSFYLALAASTWFGWGFEWVFVPSMVVTTGVGLKAYNESQMLF